METVVVVVVVVVTNSRDTKIAELKLAAYVACHGAIRGIDHLGELLKENFPCDATAQVHLHRTKCSALINNVIAPNVIEDLINDMGVDKHYSLLVDESTDISCRKDLCICIRYFSVKNAAVMSALLGIVEVISTTADALYETIKEFLENLGLDLTKMVGLGTDGASNLCGVNCSLFTKLRQHSPHLILVRCVCHSLHLCAQAAFKELPSNLEYLLRESYSWFSHSPNRRYDYEQLWQTIEGDNHALKLVAPAATRWLSLHQCIVRIIDQWDVLKLHFGLADRNERCYSARMLHEMYSDVTNRVYLTFLSPVLAEFAEMNKLFQHREADQCKLNSDLKAFATALLSRVLLPGFVSFDTDLDRHDIYKPVEKVDFGYVFEAELQSYVTAGKISREQQLTILTRCYNFLKVACKQVARRLPTSFDIFTKLELFTPAKCLSVIEKPKFSALPLYLLPKSCNVAEADKEWRQLSTVQEAFPGGIPQNLHEFWCTVWKMTNAADKQAFANISQLSFVLQLLPVSNAVVEQAFSQVSLLKTKVRNRIRVGLLSSLMILRSSLMWNGLCCKSFEPTQAMLASFNSNMYDNKQDNDDDIILALAD